jgi:hypothetical protein
MLNSCSSILVHIIYFILCFHIIVLLLGVLPKSGVLFCDSINGDMLVLHKVRVYWGVKGGSEHEAVSQGQSRAVGQRTLCTHGYIIRRIVIKQIEGNDSISVSIRSYIGIVLCDDISVIFIEAIDDLCREESAFIIL